MADGDPFRENEITHWREMRDELDEVHIGALENMEIHGTSSDELLAKAREFASKKLLEGAWASVPPPAGSNLWGDWEGTTDDETPWEREFAYPEQEFDGIRFRVQGRQRTDGEIASVEVLISGHAQLTSAQCRRLAEALTQEATTIEGLQ